MKFSIATLVSFGALSVTSTLAAPFIIGEPAENSALVRGQNFTMEVIANTAEDPIWPTHIEITLTTDDGDTESVLYNGRYVPIIEGGREPFADFTLKVPGDFPSTNSKLSVFPVADVNPPASDTTAIDVIIVFPN